MSWNLKTWPWEGNRVTESQQDQRESGAYFPHIQVLPILLAKLRQAPGRPYAGGENPDVRAYNIG